MILYRDTKKAVKKTAQYLYQMNTKTIYKFFIFSKLARMGFNALKILTVALAMLKI